MRTQDKFIAAMQTIADDHDLDLVVDPTYANTGRLYFQPRDAFEPIVWLSYNFQSGYASCDASFGLGDEERWPYLAYTPDPCRRHTLDQFVAHIRESVAVESGAAWRA